MSLWERWGSRARDWGWEQWSGGLGLTGQWVIGPGLGKQKWDLRGSVRTSKREQVFKQIAPPSGLDEQVWGLQVMLKSQGWLWLQRCGKWKPRNWGHFQGRDWELVSDRLRRGWEREYRKKGPIARQSNGNTAQAGYRDLRFKKSFQPVGGIWCHD